MALKRQEIKHSILNGTIEVLDYQLTNIVNQGWKVLNVQPITIDRMNGEFQFLYIFGKNLPDD